MKTWFFAIAFLISLASHSQGYKVRTTQNPEDRKYFKHKLDSLIRGLSSCLYITMTDEDIKKMGKEFQLKLIVTPEPYQEMRKKLDDDGVIFPSTLYPQLLREFPQFERLSLTAKSKEGKTIKIDYCFFADQSIGFYNETEKVWMKLPLAKNNE